MALKEATQEVRPIIPRDDPRQLVIFGAGVIGATASRWLTAHGDRIVLADYSPEALDGVPDHPLLSKVPIDVEDHSAVRELLRGKYGVIDVLPFQFSQKLAQAATEAGVAAYFNATEGNESTQFIRRLVRDSNTAAITQCGLAPGYVVVAAQELALQFEKLETLILRVGALPVNTSNEVQYNLSWCTESLVNQCMQGCDGIVHGRRVELVALQDAAVVNIDGEVYQAFNTSGGLGTLCDTWNGKVENLRYQSIRKGEKHREYMDFLLNGLRLRHKPELLVKLLKEAIPTTLNDVVVIHITAIGLQRDPLGRLRKVEQSFTRKIYGAEMHGAWSTAIQRTTTAGLLGMVDIFVNGDGEGLDVIPRHGFFLQEDMPFKVFSRNRFVAPVYG